MTQGDRSVPNEPRRNLHLPLNLGLLTRSTNRTYSAMPENNESAISIEMDYSDAHSHLDHTNDRPPGDNGKHPLKAGSYALKAGSYALKSGNDSEHRLLCDYSSSNSPEATSGDDEVDRNSVDYDEDEVWTDVCGWNCIKLKHCRFASWIFQVILTVGTIVGSLAASLSIGWTSRAFEGEGGCLLYSKLLLDSVNTSIEGKTKNVISVDTESSAWGANDICSYTTYTYATTAICRGIWLWMYIMLHKWFRKSNLNPNRRLLPCALMVNIALWLFTTIALGFVNEGIREWCRNIELTQQKACHFLSRLPWYTEDAHRTFNYTQILLASSWVVFVAMSLNIITDLLTIFADTTPPVNAHGVNITTTTAAARGLNNTAVDTANLQRSMSDRVARYHKKPVDTRQLTFKT